jgi:hypothetical protein
MKLPVIFALLTALFWGLYGPVLGLARAAEQNPFKPYLLIGVAYLVWAILGGAIGMKYTNVPFAFSVDGLKWGLISGSLGAFGALTLTLAMFSFEGKPKPELVMPIVFGGAVTVTALTNLVMSGQQAGEHHTSPWLWVGMVGVAVSIVIVAYNTPHVAPKKPSGTAPVSAASAPAESKLQA